MYTLAKLRTYWQPVKLWQPDETGQLVQAAFDVQLRWLPNDEHIALFERVAAERLTDAQVVPELLTGWRNLQDEAGANLAFTPENTARLLNEPLVAGVIVQAYLDSRQAAAEKNFSRPPVFGSAAAPSSSSTKPH